MDAVAIIGAIVPLGLVLAWLGVRDAFALAGIAVTVGIVLAAATGFAADGAWGFVLFFLAPLVAFGWFVLIGWLVRRRDHP